jgi:hypothetical protein
MHAVWNMHTVFFKQTWKESFRNLGVVGERILKFTLEEEGGSWSLRCSRNNVVSCWAEEQLFQVSVEFSVKRLERYTSCTQWINMPAARFPWERPRRVVQCGSLTHETGDQQATVKPEPRSADRPPTHHCLPPRSSKSGIHLSSTWTGLLTQLLASPSTLPFNAGT